VLARCPPPQITAATTRWTSIRGEGPGEWLALVRSDECRGRSFLERRAEVGWISRRLTPNSASGSRMHGAKCDGWMLGEPTAFRASRKPSWIRAWLTGRIGGCSTDSGVGNNQGAVRCVFQNSRNCTNKAAAKARNDLCGFAANMKQPSLTIHSGDLSPAASRSLSPQPRRW